MRHTLDCASAQDLVCPISMVKYDAETQQTVRSKTEVLGQGKSNFRTVWDESDGGGGVMVMVRVVFKIEFLLIMLFYKSFH